MYMALVPAKNIRNRDFAVNGSVFTTNNAYAWELASHWISSYFMGDTFLKVPSPEQAQEHAERTGAWLRKRYPDALVWANESHSSDIAFWTLVVVTNHHIYSILTWCCKGGPSGQTTS